MRQCQRLTIWSGCPAHAKTKTGRGDPRLTSFVRGPVLANSVFTGIQVLPKCTGTHRCLIFCGDPRMPAKNRGPTVDPTGTHQSINLLLFLQKQNLATAIYLFGLGTLLTGLGLKHMRICSHHDLVGALVTSLFLGRPWWSTTSPTCLPLSVFTITSDQHRCRIPPLL